LTADQRNPTIALSRFACGVSSAGRARNGPAMERWAVFLCAWSSGGLRSGHRVFSFQSKLCFGLCRRNNFTALSVRVGVRAVAHFARSSPRPRTNLLKRRRMAWTHRRLEAADHSAQTAQSRHKESQAGPAFAALGRTRWKVIGDRTCAATTCPGPGTKI
jgi:hypothetical protein